MKTHEGKSNDQVIETIRYVCVKAGVSREIMGEICHAVRETQALDACPAPDLAEKLDGLMHNPTHTEPFARFVQAMADELRANAHKGDRAGWLTMNRKEAVAEVLYHAAKLSYAAAHDDEEILEFAADVANCALMVADVCGVLTTSETKDSQ